MQSRERKAVLLAVRTVTFFLIAGCGLCVASAELLFKSSNTDTLVDNLKETIQRQEKLPIHLIYRIVFDKVQEITEVAEQAKAKTAAVSLYEAMRFSLQGRLWLTDEEFAVLCRVAAEYRQKVNVIDVEAQKLVDKFRRGIGSNNLSEVEMRNHPVVIKLAELQKKKNRLIMDYREMLRTHLGESRFQGMESMALVSFGS